MSPKPRPKDASMAQGYVGGGASVLVRSFMFIDWAAISVRHFIDAHEVRPELAYRDYLVAITAAAFAIESFVRDLLVDVGYPAPASLACSMGSLAKGSTAHGLWEQLNANFSLNPAKGTWHDELHWLFDLRNEAVHYRGSWQPLYQLPGGSRYQPLVGLYDEAAGRRGIALARDIILHCLDHPSSANPDLGEFIHRTMEGSKGVDAFAGFEK